VLGFRDGFNLKASVDGRDEGEAPDRGALPSRGRGTRPLSGGHPGGEPLWPACDDPALLFSIICVAETCGNKRLPGTTQRDLCNAVVFAGSIDVREPRKQPGAG
jgi:hypothetical protein